MRVFLAVPVPQDIKDKLSLLRQPLPENLAGVRWEKPEKLHLTLVFLGEVGEERVGELEKAVREGVKGVRGFEVGLAGVGFFPKKRPRVVLVGVGEGIEGLVQLQERLAQALAESGFTFARLSQPHVTLGRFKKGIEGIRGVKEMAGVKSLGVKFEIKEVVMMESKLQPQGAIHTPVARVMLEL